MTPPDAHPSADASPVQRDVGVVIVAAGESRRLKLGQRKPYLLLAGRPVFLRTIDLFAALDAVLQIGLVVNAKDREAVEERWGEELKSLSAGRIVVGGATRQESVRNGVEALDDSCEWVAIHDAVRPFVTPEAVDAVVRSARRNGAAILASPMKETVKESPEGRLISRTVPRTPLWCAQTPQVFPRGKYLEISARATAEGWQVTDDAQVFEMAGLPVALVEGPYDNLKITTEADWHLAQALIKARLGDQ